MLISLANKKNAGEVTVWQWHCTANPASGDVMYALVLSRPGIFGDSVTMWADIDPDILLYVFLPPLIFGEAMSLNWHHVQGRLAVGQLVISIS